MKSFTRLYEQLDASNKTNDKVRALYDVFVNTAEDDVLWMLAMILGRRTRKSITSTKMRQWAMQLSGVSPWMFEECYALVGDLSETIALLVEGDDTYQEVSFDIFMNDLLKLETMTEQDQFAWVTKHWLTMDVTNRFVFNKLLSGNLRVGVSKGLVIKALSSAMESDASIIAHRLMGDWSPRTTTYRELFGSDISNSEHTSKPYPFCLAYPVVGKIEDMGRIEDWQIEWKWDGIRAQVIVRDGQLYIWTRGEELVTDRYPELHGILDEASPFTSIVLDGEIVAYKNSGILSFGELQKRIGRTSISKKLLDDIPVAFIAYDILEIDTLDIRNEPLNKRRARLSSVISGLASPAYMISPVIEATSWPDVEKIQGTAREQRSEGLMLKRISSSYHHGRKKGDWWKWKVNPYSVDAVLVYAQAGHGIRASLYTDYTFAIWKDGILVPFAKAYSGLTNDEIKEVDAYIRKHTLEKFGPVRTVQPELVFEIAFEGLQKSARHKSGVAVRFPRILSFRRDKKAADADTLETVLALLESHAGIHE